MSFLWHGLTEQGAQVPVQVDAQGRVIAVDGTPGVSNWERTGTTLSPAVPGDSVDIGSGNISLNADGSAVLNGNVDTPLTLNSNQPSTYISLTNSAFSDGYLAYEGQNITQWVGGDRRTLLNKDGNLYIGGLSNINSITPNITLNASGSAEFASVITAGDTIQSTSAVNCFVGRDANNSNTLTSNIAADGSATFAGNITAPNVTFRSADPQFYVKKSKNKDASPEYVGPELDLLAEIARLEALVRHLYETLRLAPPAGWPVWDGNDDVLRQLRK